MNPGPYRTVLLYKNNMIVTILASLILVGGGVGFYFAFKNLLKLQKDYEEDRAQLKVNGALFEGEEKFTKEQITEVMQNFVYFEKMLTDKQTTFEEIRAYAISATQRLEQRPEQVRKELKKDVETLLQQNRELLRQVQLVDRKIEQERSILFSEIQSIKAKLYAKDSTKRSY